MPGPYIRHLGLDLRHHPIRSMYIAGGGAARGAALRAPGAGLPQPPPGAAGLPAAHGHGRRRNAALLVRAGLLRSLCPPPWQRQQRACSPGLPALLALLGLAHGIAESICAGLAHVGFWTMELAVESKMGSVQECSS